MKYIQVTIFLPLILPIDKPGNIKWYVEAEFALHKDTRSHIGSFVTMVTVGSYVQYIKQKLNTNGSIEAKLVRFHDFLTQVICT